MAKIEKFEALVSGGVINLYQLKTTATEQDNYVLAIVAADKHYVVPMLRNGTTSIAYVDASLEDAEYEVVSDIIVNMFANKVYKGINSFKPRAAVSVPEHCKEIASFIQTVAHVKASEADQILKDAGYIFGSTELATSSKQRDWSALIASDPVAKKIMDENKAQLDKIGATFESLPDEAKVLYEPLLNGSCQGAIFMGPTGTGKSYGTRIFANKLGAPYTEIQINFGTHVEDLIGQYVPRTGASIEVKTFVLETMAKVNRGDICATDALTAIESAIKVAGEQGNWEFVPGPLLVAFYRGWVIGINECNFGMPAIIAVLNEFTDDTVRICVGGKYYERNANFVVFLTMNPGYKGTQELNVALKNRFPKVDFPALTKSEFCRRAMGFSKNLGHMLSAQFYNKLFDFAALIEKTAGETIWHENVKFSIRNANRLSGHILAKTRSYEEFAAAVAVEYLNDLTCDHDHSAQLATFKSSTDIQDKIRDLYSCYDFCEVTTVTVSSKLSDLVAGAADVSTSTKGKSAKSVDDLMAEKAFEGMEEDEDEESDD